MDDILPVTIKSEKALFALSTYHSLQFASEIVSCFKIVTNYVKQIGETDGFDKWVPHELSRNQQKHWFKICSAPLLCHKTDTFIDRIVR